jgi:hypothetical protein
MSLGKGLHLAGAILIDLVEVGQLVLVGGQNVDPQILFQPGSKRIRAGEDQIDVDAVRILLRLDLARKLRGRSLGEGDARDEVRVALR